MITIIPAIDLKDGKCVRLRQGRADEVTVYSQDPVAMARHWESEGAEYLHVVDLDGAFQGKPVHSAVIAEIASAIKIPVEAGGGLRTAEDIATLLDSGVAHTILGTRACEDPEALTELVKRFGARLAVGIDARGGLVQTKGWVETSSVQAVDLAARVDSAGVKTIIYTDTAVDGMMTGPNIDAINEICDAVSCDVVASGGIVSTKDVRALCLLGHTNLCGAIVGKALYEEAATLKELIEAGGKAQQRN